MSPLVNDYKLNKADASPRLQQLLREMIDILNNDGYQRKVYTSAPTSGSPGIEGEKRVVVSGATLREYMYANGQWWKSDPAETSGWSAV